MNDERGSASASREWARQPVPLPRSSSLATDGVSGHRRHEPLDPRPSTLDPLVTLLPTPYSPLPSPFIAVMLTAAGAGADAIERLRITAWPVRLNTALAYLLQPGVFTQPL